MYRVSLVAKIEKVEEGKTKSMLNSTFSKEIDFKNSIGIADFFEQKLDAISTSAHMIVESERQKIDAANEDQSENKSVIIYGPQGSGKTKYIETFKKHFKLNKAIEDYVECEQEIPRTGCLVLSNENLDYVSSNKRVMHISEAKKICGINDEAKAKAKAKK